MPDREALSIPSRLTWAASGLAVTQALALVKIGVLARVLSAEELGVYALVMTYAEGSARFNDLGLEAAIVHFRSLTDRQLNALLYLGVGAALLTLGATVGIVALAEAPRTLALFLGVGLAALVRVPGTQAAALLQARHRHDTLARVGIASALAGDLLAIALLLSGSGLLAVVSGLATSAIVYAIGMFTAADVLRVRGTWRAAALPEVRPVLAFAGYQFLAGLCNLLMHRLDRFLLLAAYGLETLGAYELAKQLTFRPYRLIGTVVYQVYFPVYAELQADLRRLRATYLSVLRATVLVTAPAYLLLAVYAEEASALLFGPGLPVAPRMIRALSSLGFAYSVIHPIGSFLRGVGRSRAELAFQASAAVALATALTLAIAAASGGIIPALTIYGVLGGAGLLILDYGWRRRYAQMSAWYEVGALLESGLWATLVTAVTLAGTSLATTVLPTVGSAYGSLAIAGVVYGTYVAWRLAPRRQPNLAP